MAGKLLSRKAQIAVELEAVEGTAETLVAADAGMLVYDPEYSLNLGRFQRNPARATLSQLAGIIGAQGAGISWATELKGSGAIATEPAWSDAIQLCGFAKATVSNIDIGAVAGGPFIPGETITGGTSAATGRVVGEVANGDSEIPFVLLSGTWQSGEVATGGTSGATATTSSTIGSDKGFEYRPVSSSVPSGTVGLYEDGLRKMIHGARGNLTIEANLGEPAFLNFGMSGVYNAETDTALLSPTYESTVPKAFLNIGATVLSDAAALFTTMNIEMANEIVARESANAAKGILSYLITGRAPTASFNVEKKLVADHDAYGALIAGTTGRLYAELPGAAGEKITIASPRCLYSDVGRSDRSGLKIADVVLELVAATVSGGDDELQIGMI